MARVSAWARLSGGWRLAGALALGVLAAGVWWLGMPEEVVSVTRRVELPEEWEVVAPEVEPVVSAPPTPEPVAVAPAPEPGVAAPAPKPTPEPTPRGPLRPTLVSVPGGTFDMGSTKEALLSEFDRIDWVEEALHGRANPDEPGFDWAEHPNWAEDHRKANENELPQRELTIPAFQMCETEVTQGQYEAVMGVNPSAEESGRGDDLPVQSVSWYDAVAYLNKLTMLESVELVALGEAALTACYEGSGGKVDWVEGCTGYRLPTEAEWEYAARAETTTSWSFGDDPAVAKEYGWYLDNAEGKVHTVGGLKANAWGLYDIHGNVWEWVWDAYDSYKSDNVVNSVGTKRALRGGSFNDTPRNLRSASRNWGAPGYQGRYGGFRCVRGVGPRR